MKKNILQLGFAFSVENYAGLTVLVGLSGGINSMAVLCWLAQLPVACRPAVVHLFYAHFDEHSPDTLPFVLAGVAFAKKSFSQVVYKQTDNSVLGFFETQHMIPAPMLSPCTRALKMEPMFKYMEENSIDIDLVGYVSSEKRRVNRMAKRTGSPADNVVLQNGIPVHFPFRFLTDNQCFALVVECIGWYPAIYDLRSSDGERVFKHNNCLPCKNMTPVQLQAVLDYYPEKMASAQALSERLSWHWGRDADAYYTQFGRQEYELGAGSPCEICTL